MAYGFGGVDGASPAHGHQEVGTFTEICLGAGQGVLVLRVGRQTVEEAGRQPAGAQELHRSLHHRGPGQLRISHHQGPAPPQCLGHLGEAFQAAGTEEQWGWKAEFQSRRSKGEGRKQITGSELQEGKHGEAGELLPALQGGELDQEGELHDLGTLT